VGHCPRRYNPARLYHFQAAVSLVSQTADRATTGDGILAEPLLSIEQVTCERDERPLFSDLTLLVHAGDRWQILGPNGSGKTTLLRTLAGVGQPSRGQLLWRGEPVTKVGWDYRQALLYLGHAPGIKAGLSPLENLRWYQALSGGSQRGDIIAALAQVGLKGYEHLPAYQLSAGQLRRVALARLYLSQALLWILDEPFTAIDKAGVAALEQRLDEHSKAGGAVIFTSHQEVQLPGLQSLDLRDFPARELNFEQELGTEQESSHAPLS